jgi:hypothetical protein
MGIARQDSYPMGNVTHVYCAIKELVEIGLIKSDDGKKVKLHGVTVGGVVA